MENQTYALITGGTMGIGLELCRLLAKDGYNLIIVARHQTELSETAEMLQNEFGITVSTISKDLFEPNAAFDLYDEVSQMGLHIDILINDAGQGSYGLFVDTDIEKELAIIQLNICSLTVLTKLFLKDMVSRGSGRILNVSSIASKLPGPWQSVYHGTKAYVQSFTQAVREEVKDSGVTLTLLLPGATDTDFFNKAGMEESKVVQEGKLDDPAAVAQDGYKAMMKGEDMIVSGLKNKMMVGMSAVTPDEMLAGQMEKKQQPSEKK